MEFLPRTLIFYMLSHTYLFWHFFRLSGKKRAFWLTLPLFAAMGLFPFVYQNLPAGSDIQAFFGRAGAVWLPVAFFCLAVFVAADAVALLLMALCRLFPGFRCPFLTKKRYLVLLLVVGAGLYGYGVYEAHTLHVTKVTLVTDKLPPDRASVRIVFAADMHVGPQTGTALLSQTVSTCLPSILI